MGERNQSDQSATAENPNAKGGSQPQQQAGQRTQQAGQTSAEETTTRGAKAVSWFTETFLRSAIAVIGVVLLLVALGQMAGVDTFSIIGSILGTDLAQWGAVALFGLLLVVAASKSWTFVSQ